MADLSKLYKDLINNLDKSIKDEKMLDNIKHQVYELMISSLDSINNIVDIQDRQCQLEKNMKKLQKKVSRIEEDIYIYDDDDNDGDKMHDNDYEFEIRCPYCNEDFIISNESKNSFEIECPNCHNLIELDWNGDEECCNCDECKEGCYEDDDEESKNIENVAEKETEYKLENNDKVQKDKKQNDSNNMNQKNKNEDDM